MNPAEPLLSPLTSQGPNPDPKPEPEPGPETRT